MNATDKITSSAAEYRCPSWCDGGDHEPLIPGEPAEHWTSVGDFREGGKEWEVTVAKPIEPAAGDRPLVQVGAYDYDRHDLSQCRVTPSAARSLAALLIRGADQAEMES